MASCSNPKQAFLPLFSFYFIFLLLSMCPVAYSMSFEFTSFNQDQASVCREGSGGICIQGDAMILQSDHVIQLTMDSSSTDFSGTVSIGRAAYSDPILLWNSTTQALNSFTTHFTFKMKGNRSSDYHGDGMAFFLSPYPSNLPSNRGKNLLGLFNNVATEETPANTVVAVEFDTWDDDWDPDGDDHVGIDVNSIVSKVTTTWDSSMIDGRIANSWVRYNSTTFNLSIFLTYEVGVDVNEMESCLSYIIDLRKILPERIAVRFSSSSYNSPELHSLLSWSFNSSLEANKITNQTIQTNQTSTNLGNKNNRSPGTEQNDNLVLKIVVPVAVVVVFFILLVIVGLLLKRRVKNYQSTNFDKGERPREFSYSALVSATNTFSEERKLGVGGSGAVYSGFLPDLGIDVAVKRFTKESAQGEKAFEAEVNVISNLRHRNLVKLLGWCHDNNELLLVYELMSNRSLDHWLFGRNDNILLWNLRYKIAVGLASALHYLHEEWEQCVIHRDIKSSNVMLDSNFNAKLGDFGLARFAEHGVGPKTTTLFGTVGYMAPECLHSGKSTKESDIYSFGVVLLEIACGRGASKMQLVEWVWQNYEKWTLLEVVDVNMKLDEVEKELVMRLILVGLWCSNPNPGLRPSIRQVVFSLDMEGPLPRVPPRVSTPLDYPSPIQTDRFLSSTSSRSLVMIDDLPT